MPYTCTFTGAPGQAGEVLVDIAWDATEHGTPTGQAHEAVAVELDERTEAALDRTVQVIDSLADPETLGEVTWPEEGRTTEFNYSATFDGEPGSCQPYDNTARLVADGLELGSDTETVEVCWPWSDLTVTDVVIPQFDRDHDWSVTKDVDRTEAQAGAGESASFDYSLVVTPTPGEDSNFRYRGVATVHNPNDVDVTGVDLTDDLWGHTETLTAADSERDADSGRDR